MTVDHLKLLAAVVPPRLANQQVAPVDWGEPPYESKARQKLHEANSDLRLRNSLIHRREAGSEHGAPARQDYIYYREDYGQGLM